jgi:hypothetical protein
MLEEEPRPRKDIGEDHRPNIVEWAGSPSLAKVLPVSPVETVTLETGMRRGKVGGDG